MSESDYFAALAKFQFLIGKVQPNNGSAIEEFKEKFQFLIGKVQHGDNSSIRSN